jgi:hypothetical protein
MPSAVVKMVAMIRFFMLRFLPSSGIEPQAGREINDPRHPL